MESCARNGPRLHCFLDRRARRSGPCETAPGPGLWSAAFDRPGLGLTRAVLRPQPGPAGANPHSRRVASGFQLPLVRMARLSKSWDPALRGRCSDRAAVAGLPRLRRERVTGLTQARAADAYPGAPGT